MKTGNHLHYYHCLLNHITDPSCDEVKEDVNTALGCRVDLDCCLADGFDTFSHEVDVDF